MGSVSIHPPKTPITKGSLGIAKATLPNVCKMPGPPAPFVPTPLPNIGKSGDSPEGYSTSVKIEGHAVAIQGASFKSMGDVASKGLGGGMLSMNTHGPTKFIGPGSLTVKIEGKAVHLKGEPMFNNCGPSGSPPNASTLSGEDQSTGSGDPVDEDECDKLKADFDITVASHKENTSGATKMTSSSKTPGASQQSHHIFQDAALKGMVPRAAALAVMLANSFKGTEHGDITGEQNSRRYNKTRGGVTPGKTFGEIKTQARDDLAKGLEGKRNHATDERPMTPEEAKKAADCIVAEAEETAKEEYKKATRKDLTDATPVKQPGECLAAGTLVTLSDGQLRAVELLRIGDMLRTHDSGTRGMRITRIDQCRSSLVVLCLLQTRLELAPYHRLFDHERRPIRADELRVGDCVQTSQGLQPISWVGWIEVPATIYRLGLSHTSSCFLGPDGVVAELIYGGPPVVRREDVTVLAPHACSTI